MSNSESPIEDGKRRVLRFQTTQDLADDLQALRAGPVLPLKKWTLPQACWHLAMVIEGNLAKPDAEERTPEQEAAKTKFFGMVMSEQGMPENLPLPDNFNPPADCGVEQIDRLLAAFDRFDAFPHSFLAVGRCGPVSKEEVRRLHLKHAEHHLSFQKIAARRETLGVADIDALIAEIRRLQKGYVKTGNWSLEQMCWHLNTATTRLMSGRKPDNTPGATPTPPDGPAKLAAVLKGHQVPGGIEAPEAIRPPDNCVESDIDAFVSTLERLKTFAGPFAPHRIFGPLTTEQGKKLVLLHSARHLSHLVPTRTIPVK